MSILFDEILILSMGNKVDQKMNNLIDIRYRSFTFRLLIKCDFIHIFPLAHWTDIPSIFKPIVSQVIIYLLAYIMGVYGESTGVILRVDGVEVHPTPHFVPEGISSSVRDFIFLVF